MLVLQQQHCTFQITTIGRYGGSTTRSRIPIGCFYGHTTLLPWEVDANHKERGGTMAAEKAGVLSQLGTLVSCHFSCVHSILQCFAEEINNENCFTFAELLLTREMELLNILHRWLFMRT